MVRKRTIGQNAFTAITIGVAALLGAFIFLYAVASPPLSRHGDLSLALGPIPASAKPATEVAAHDTAAVRLQAPSRQATADAAARRRFVANYEMLPLAFEANQGQTDAQVRFLSHGVGYTLFLTPVEAVLSLASPSNTGGTIVAKTTVQSSMVRMRLAGANPHPQIQGRDKLRGKSNYLLGNDPKKWRTNVPNYARVEYTNIYPGVNLVYYGHQGQIEDDFEVEPGANPSTICLEISGTKKIALDRAGNAVLSVPGGVILKTPGDRSTAQRRRRSATKDHRALRPRSAQPPWLLPRRV